MPKDQYHPPRHIPFEVKIISSVMVAAVVMIRWLPDCKQRSK